MTTTPGIGLHWLTPRLGEFLDLYPDIRISLVTTEEELDLAMREADVAIRSRQPTQPDLIQRKLFSVHFHVMLRRNISSASARRGPSRISTTTAWWCSAATYRNTWNARVG